MADLKVIIVGAAGRMGRMLIQTVAATDGMNLVGAIERDGAPTLGQDSGLLSGIGANDVMISDDPLPLFAKADAVIDFTTPASTIH